MSAIPSLIRSITSKLFWKQGEMRTRGRVSGRRHGSHPAAVPVIGYLKPLSQLTRADVLAYHARTYVPQNMVFVIVGDVDVEASLARCRKAFAGFARGRSPDVRERFGKP